MFCMSVAIFAVLPPLFAIMDDTEYVYVDDDVSFKLSISLYNNRLFLRLTYQRQLRWPRFQATLQQPPPTKTVIAVSEFRMDKTREGVTVEGE